MEAVRLAYVGGFGLAAMACFLSMRRVSRVTDPDTQRGLGALLGLGGGWAVAHIGRLLPISPTAQVAFYLVGLVVGLATIGAWLYFASAYTGHDYHRRPRIRRAALSLYLGISLIKITNPLHGMYFDTTTTTQPFAHVVIELGTIHWVVTGLSYALASIGFYLVYEMLDESKSDTRVLGALVATTSIPIIFYVISLTDSTGLITLHYEPLGVAVFAVGVLYVVEDQFIAIPRFWRRQIIDDIDEAVVVIDDLGHIRDYNQRAIEMFPELYECEGTPLSETLPELARVSEREDGIMTIGQDDKDTERYFHLTATSLTQADLEVGQAIVCTDVTNVERQRRQLKRKNEQLECQNEQLDDFAEAMTHELRNTLAIAEGYVEMIATQRTETSTRLNDDTVGTIKKAHERMECIVTDLARLARRAQTIDEIEECSLSEVVEAAHNHIHSDGLSICLDEDTTLRVNRALLTELHLTAGRFADLNNATDLKVGIDQEMITITTDGDPIPAEMVDNVFAYGEATPSAETGMLFPTMEAIASSHGWTVDIDPTYQDGVLIEIGGVEMCSSAA
ncbi:histidine kinase N-terminal 7TM domain-containing protein [Halorubrum sp. N11]|uniref:histidine kinase N-terminal 7TM domain-containing protein n=1 Tax=Halorubrum sp. N11 TaxID=3402276 RepID=UPI003EB7F657